MKEKTNILWKVCFCVALCFLSCFPFYIQKEKLSSELSSCKEDIERIKKEYTELDTDYSEKTTIEDIKKEFHIRSKDFEDKRENYLNISKEHQKLLLENSMRIYDCSDMVYFMSVRKMSLESERVLNIANKNRKWFEDQEKKGISGFRHYFYEKEFIDHLGYRYDSSLEKIKSDIRKFELASSWDKKEKISFEEQCL